VSAVKKNNWAFTGPLKEKEVEKKANSSKVDEAWS
jgi:hypothetical protein